MIYPRYNPALDFAFPPRSQNPMRYGLTAQQMKELKDTGKWQQFKSRWDGQRESHRKRNNPCYVCGDVHSDNIPFLHTHFCTYCAAQIRELVGVK